MTNHGPDSAALHWSRASEPDVVASPETTTASFTIVRAFRPIRKAAAAYLETHHYMRSAGGSGQMFAVMNHHEQVNGAVLIGATASRNCDHSIAGACLIGPTASADAERGIAGSGVCIRQIKRSHLRDGVPMYESHLLRHAMQRVCDEYDAPVLYVVLRRPRSRRTSAAAGRCSAGPISLPASSTLVRRPG